MIKTQYKFRDIVPRDSWDIQKQAADFLAEAHPEIALKIRNTKEFWPILISELSVDGSQFVNGYLIHGDTPVLTLNPDELPSYADALIGYAFLLEEWTRCRGKPLEGHTLAKISFPSNDMTREAQNEFLARLGERQSYIMFHLLRHIFSDVTSDDIRGLVQKRGLMSFTLSRDLTDPADATSTKTASSDSP